MAELQSTHKLLQFTLRLLPGLMAMASEPHTSPLWMYSMGSSSVSLGSGTPDSLMAWSDSGLHTEDSRTSPWRLGVFLMTMTAASVPVRRCPANVTLAGGFEGRIVFKMGSCQQRWL